MDDFKKILSTHILTLGDFAEFAKQLEKEGYVLSVTTSSKGIRFRIEKPNFIQLIQRIVATITQKRLKLTSWQKYAFRQAIHYNYKSNQDSNFDKPVWVKRALAFKPKIETPRDTKEYNFQKRPKWVLRALRFRAKSYYSREAVEHG